MTRTITMHLSNVSRWKKFSIYYWSDRGFGEPTTGIVIHELYSVERLEVGYFNLRPIPAGPSMKCRIPSIQLETKA
jgi:hypothetical protein